MRAVHWQIFRAATLLRVALELGRVSNQILTINLHVIAHKPNSDHGRPVSPPARVSALQ